MMNIGSTTQLEGPTTNSLYKVGDLFVAEIDGMRDSGVCTYYGWSAKYKTWLYTIKWTRASYKDQYTEVEIEISLAGGVWQRHERKENQV
jgi:hypothetical protein